MRTLTGLASIALGLLTASLAGAADARSYVSGNFFMDLDGEKTGFLKSVDGGAITAEVVSEEPGAAYYVKKHIGTIKYDDISLVVEPAAVQGALRDWLSSMLAGKPLRKGGAVVAVGSDGTETSRIEFDAALLTEFCLPTLDATDRHGAGITIKLSPEVTRHKAGSGKEASSGGDGKQDARQKVWLPSNFRLQIGDLPCGKVNKIEALVVKQKVVEHAVGEQRDYQKEPAKVEVPNLRLELSAADAKPWRDWFDSFVLEGRSSDAVEVDGSLALLADDGKTELLRLLLRHVGIFRLANVPAGPASGGDRLAVGLYVEQIELAPAK